MRCALWLRVSHDTGDQSAESQRLALEENPTQAWEDVIGEIVESDE